MRSLRLLLWGIFGACAVGVLSVNCGAADAIFDCQSVCQRYHDCYDANYDVGACRDGCRSRSSNDPSFVTPQINATPASAACLAWARPSAAGRRVES
jgi:hypothetical protein